MEGVDKGMEEAIMGIAETMAITVKAETIVIKFKVMENLM